MGFKCLALMIVFFNVFSTTFSYRIHDSCFHMTAQDAYPGEPVIEIGKTGMDQAVYYAAEEAKNVAEYAKFRLQRNFPPVDPQMISRWTGSDAANFQAKMDQVIQALGTYTGRFDPNLMGIDRTVVIYCKDDHFKLIKNDNDPDPARRAYLHDEVLGTNLALPKIDERPVERTQCTVPGSAAYSYSSPPNLPNQPQGAIVLCETLKNFPLLGARSMIGDMSGWAFDMFQGFISESIFHEALHRQPGFLPGTLPSGHPEAYLWNDISQLNDVDKQANPEGYAKLAFGMYMPNYPIVPSALIPADTEGGSPTDGGPGFGNTLLPWNDGPKTEEEWGPHILYGMGP